MRPGPTRILACPHCGALVKQRTLSSGNTFGARQWTDGKHVAPMLPRTPPLARCRQCRDFFFRAKAPLVGTLSPGQEMDAKEWSLTITSFERRMRRPSGVIRRLFGDATNVEIAAKLPVTAAAGLGYLEASTLATSLTKWGATVTYASSIRANYAGPAPRAWIEAPDPGPLTERDLLDALALGVAGEAREGQVELRVLAWHAANDARRETSPEVPVAWSDEARENLERLVVLLDEGTAAEQCLKAEALRELGRFDEALALLSRPTDARYTAAATRLRELAERGIAGVAPLLREGSGDALR
jgi:hypothetical protein